MGDPWLKRVRGAAGRVYRSLVPVRDFLEFARHPDEVPTAEKDQSELHRMFYGNTGPVGHKWRHYLEIYGHHLARFRNTRFRLLEIGVADGGSLTLWRKYFGSDATIFGIDISPRCAQFDKQAGNVRIGSQDDPQFLQSVVSEMGGIDVVIDDGSHIADHQRVTFRTLFPLLNANGVYICEDLHTAYSRAGFDGGYHRRGTFIEVVKQIIDDIHADFHKRAQSVPDAHRSIHGIHVYNSILAIEKRALQKPEHVRVGTEAT
jgi:hypothetical protein